MAGRSKKWTPEEKARAREAAEERTRRSRAERSREIALSVIEQVRELEGSGQAVLPSIPSDVARGLDAEFEDRAIEFSPDHYGRAGLSASGKGATVYWTPERRKSVANEVCLRLASGQTLKEILSADRDHSRLPAEESFLRWIFVLGDEYVTQAYHLGRMMRAEGWVDEIVAIADDAKDCEDLAMVQGHRLAIEARQWVAERVIPRLYGRKGEGSHGVTVNINTNLGGDDEGDDGAAYRVVAEIGK